MLTGAVSITKLAVYLGVMNFFVALIDSSWSGPINTALFILLAYVNYHIAKRTKGHDKQIKDVKRKVDAERRKED